MSGKTKNKGNACVARRKTTTPKRASGTGRVTKKQELILLLSKKTGTDVATLSAKFGWQNHTTRAALSGLRKAGFELTKIKASDGKRTRYRIVDTPPLPAVSKSKEEAATDAR